MKFTHLIDPASSDGRTMDKILEEEILFLNRLWRFCEEEFRLKQKSFFT